MPFFNDETLKILLYFDFLRIFYVLTVIKPFCCTKFVIPLVKGFQLVREMQGYTTEF